MSKKEKLVEVNKKLDDEIKRVEALKAQFDAWSKKERENINLQRSEKLRTGKISLHELNEIIEILENYGTATPSQKQFVENTLLNLARMPTE